MVNFHRNLISFRAAYKCIGKYFNEEPNPLPRVAAFRVVRAIMERLEKDGYSIVKLEQVGTYDRISEQFNHDIPDSVPVYRIIGRKEELDAL